MIGTATTDTIVLKSKRLQLNFVPEHRAELPHRVIIQVIIVKEDFLKRGILDKCTSDSFQTRIADQVGLKSQTSQTVKLLKTDLGNLSGSTNSNHVVWEAESLEHSLVDEHLGNLLSTLSIDLIRVQADVRKCFIVHQSCAQFLKARNDQIATVQWKLPQVWQVLQGFDYDETVW